VRQRATVVPSRKSVRITRLRDRRRFAQRWSHEGTSTHQLRAGPGETHHHRLGVIYGLLFGKLPALRAAVIALKFRSQFTFQEANPNAPKTPVFHRPVPASRARVRNGGANRATYPKS